MPGVVDFRHHFRQISVPLKSLGLYLEFQPWLYSETLSQKVIMFFFPKADTRKMAQ